MAYHTRSNSFPSRSHPYTAEIDQHLSRLRDSQATSISSSSSISHQINGLQDLHVCVDKWLQLSQIQQSLAKDQVDELLNGSLRLLDMCSIANEALLQTKECIQGLQSIFRRRKGNEIGLANEIKKYLSSRKAVKKAIHKALGKKSSSPISEGHDTISTFREVEAVTFSVVESLLSLISGLRAPSKLSSWSLVSKLMHPKRIASEEQTVANEFGKVDAELSTLTGHKTSKSDGIFQLQSQLKELESGIQDLEEGLECLSRRLIKTRVSLLNIFNN